MQNSCFAACLFTAPLFGIEPLMFSNLCLSPEDPVCRALFTMSYAFGYYLTSNFKSKLFC